MTPSRPPITADARRHGRARSTVNPVDPLRIRRLRRALLRWGKSSGRDFAWRRSDVTPFEVLVTEILLSKTRAEAVAPVGHLLFEQYRQPADLARAKRRTLEKLLYPLGLHRKRARNLVECASSLVNDHRGVVPESVADLMQLPSVGRYAANATASVAFHQRLAVVDANVARIYQRVFSLPEIPPRLSTAHDLWTLAQRILPTKRVREFNWALLDLGGTICTARRPSCESCPLAAICDLRAKQKKTASSSSKRGDRVGRI